MHFGGEVTPKGLLGTRFEGACLSGLSEESHNVLRFFGQSPQKYKKCKFAFTLAEVLITLGIIGVVAALTIPTLTIKHQKQEALARLKKVYATLSVAFRDAVFEHGPLDTWDWSDNETVLRTYLVPKFNTVKVFSADCIYGDCYCTSRTSAWESYKWPGGQGITSPMPSRVASVQFQDSSCFHVSKEDSWRGGGAVVWIDINGSSGRPNKIAKDVFVFRVSNNGKLLKHNWYACSDDLDATRSGTGTDCGGRIVEDGWQINYDWNF